MLGNRADIEVETLLKVILGLLAVLLALEIIGFVVEGLVTVLGLLQPLLTLVVLVLIVLWLLDRL